jgi:hypothetical protein
LSDIVLPNDFSPRWYQRPYMAALDSGKKRAFWVLHRRGGKDLVAMHQTAKMAHDRIGAYWHIYPTFAQARKAIWEGFTKEGKRIMENVFPGFGNPGGRHGIVARKSEQQMLVELKCGSIWSLIGSDKVELVGAGPVGLVFSEFALAKPKAWQLISPMLMENQGWASFITTPRGKNHAWKLYNIAKANPATWWSDLKTLKDTRAYDPEATYAQERADGKPEALIRQEYECDWAAALVGSVWGDLLEVLERSAEPLPDTHEKDFVFVSFDLGISDATSMWFWRLNGNEVEVLDFYENQGKPISHYCDVLEQKGYSYRTLWLPHDAKARTLQTGVSILDQLVARYGSGKVDITPSLSLMDGIQAGRWLLQQRIRFHPRCEEGLEALKQYHYEYDEDAKTFGTKPEHDWSSHAADAFRYLAVVARMGRSMGKKGGVEESRLVSPLDKGVPVPFSDSFSLEDLWQTAPSNHRSGRWNPKRKR